MDWQIRNRLMAAITGFKKPQLIMNLQTPDDFEDFDNRLVRYQLLWGFYENTVYDDFHRWATLYKRDFGMYRYNRNIFTPANRLANFHQAHIWGGMLDLQAGNGVELPSALPIITDNDEIREPISNVWSWSNWQHKKDLVPLQGCAMGDSFIRIVDNQVLKRVYFEIVHPKIVKNIEKDDFGNVKSYVLEEERIDPNNPSRTVTYTELAGRDENNDIVFRTLLNNSPYPWNADTNGEPISEWTVNYGFVPFLHNPHIDVGGKYGWSEMHAGRGKFQDLDDIGSQLADYIRKEVQGKWMIAGASKPTSSKMTQGDSSRDRVMPGREEQPIMWQPNSDAKAFSLISNMSIADVVEFITTMLDDISRDYPELMLDESDENVAESGVARRIRQQPAATKIQTRRVGYDDMMVKANQMALSIGGINGYPGFEGITDASYEQGHLDHSIGRRDVFVNDEFENLQESKLFWEVTAQIMATGVPLETALKSQGWDEEQIANFRTQSRRVQSLTERRKAAQPVEINTQTSTDIIEETQAETE